MSPLRWILFLVISSLVSMAQAQGGSLVSGVFMVVKGDVKILSATSKATEPAKIGKKVTQGDTIISGPDSRAKIIMEDKNVLNIAPDSKVIIEKYTNDGKDSRNVDLKVEYGKVRASVEQKYDGQKNTFNVKTPTAVAGVRGTDFITSYSSKTGKTTIVTFHGAVQFGTPGPGGKIEGAVLVSAGMTGEKVPGQPPAPPAPMPKEEMQKMDTESDATKAPDVSGNSQQGGNQDTASEKEAKKEESNDPGQAKSEEKSDSQQDAKKEETRSDSKNEQKESAEQKKEPSKQGDPAKDPESAKQTDQSQDKKEPAQSSNSDQQGPKEPNQGSRSEDSTKKPDNQGSASRSEDQKGNQSSGQQGANSSPSTAGGANTAGGESSGSNAKSAPAGAAPNASAGSAGPNGSPGNSGGSPNQSPSPNSQKQPNSSTPPAAGNPTSPGPGAGRAPASMMPVGGMPSMIDSRDLSPDIGKDIRGNMGPQVRPIFVPPPAAVPRPPVNNIIDEAKRNGPTRVIIVPKNQ